MKEEKSAPVSESELFRRRHAIHIICPVFPIYIGAKCPVFPFKFGAFPCFIKFLVDEGKYRYIISGSNLGVELRGIRSIPVGYASALRMVPMCFEEFALASGIPESMLSHVKECFDKTVWQ